MTDLQQFIDRHKKFDNDADILYNKIKTIHPNIDDIYPQVFNLDSKSICENCGLPEVATYNKKTMSIAII